MKKLKYSLILLGVGIMFLYAIQAKNNINIVFPMVDIESSISYMSIPSIKSKVYRILQKYRYEDNVLSQMEESLEKNPCVEKANVYTDIYGNVKIRIEERVPTLRIFTPWNYSFYIDKQLHQIPAQSIEKALTLVCIGYPKQTVDSTLFASLNQWTVLIRKEEYLSKYFSHFSYVDSKHVEIVPIYGSPIAIIPIEENAEKISQQLAYFYEHILPQKGWNYYKTLNFKFKNQVVAEKNS